jgi:cytoskeleton protein RodZ
MPVKLMTYSVIAAVFLLAVLWLRNEPDPSHDTVEALPALSNGEKTEEVRDTAAVQMSVLGYSYPEIAHDRFAEPQTEVPEYPLPAATLATTAVAGESVAVPTRLAVSVDEPTWIEVKDGNGTRLYYAIAQAGRSLAFGGPEPFTIVVGNAEATSVSFDGQAVDIQPFSRQKVARFTIDRDGPHPAADL